MNEHIGNDIIGGAVAQFEPLAMRETGPPYEIIVAMTTGSIVEAYIEKNAISPLDAVNVLGGLVREISGALLDVVSVSGDTAEDTVEEQPAAGPFFDVKSTAEIKASITPDALISFLDGKPYKTLKRHLGTHGLDAEGYRARYGLPPDYPTVAANYSAARSALAKQAGLGVPAGKAPRAAA